MLADNVARMRNSLHWSQRKLASVAELDPGKISRIENGAKANHEDLAAIAKALNCTTDFLLAEHEGAAVFFIKFVDHLNEIAKS